MSAAASRPIVLVADPLAAAAIDVLAADFEVRNVDGTDRAALLEAIVDVDAVIVRSATTIDAQAVLAAGRLRVVARAGIGLDNVDVAAATARGVLVVNAPTSNIVSAAEHAMALLLAVARNVAAADASLKAGEWRRSAFTGVELADKTVGIVGLGRIGVLVAQRLAGFGVRLLAYDPYVTVARAAQVGAELGSLADVLAQSDFVTIHLPKTPETIGLIGAEELAAAKPGLRIINAARGGLIDEAALADAVRSGQVAGAGIDVFATEPCTDSPLFALPGVVVTPHLGASTSEAQDKAGIAVARSIRLALQGEFVPDAVNVQAGGPVVDEVRPALGLVEKLGRVFTALAAGVAASVGVEVRGEVAEFDVRVLQLAALKGIFNSIVEEPVTFVNAPLLAKERGVDVGLSTYAESEDYRSLITVRGVLPSGESISVSGTLSGPKHNEKITEVSGFDVDLRATGHLVFFRYRDRPGVVGTIGADLGSADINIVGAQVSRPRADGEALMVLQIESPLPPEVLNRISAAIGATYARSVDLDDERDRTDRR
ncbi:MAG: phosphoglycerate dehydrogenase [Mycobacteriales bacterium]|nr:MAG: phosphoglycerate dehydrogenase [Pseudonocardiales bacterium]